MKYATVYKHPTKMQWFILSFFFVIQTVLSSDKTPPAFKSTPPSVVTAREGESLLLRCSAAGRPTPVITWYKDDWQIANGQDGIRLSDDELAVTSLQKMHKGKYTCRAQNVEGQMEHSTTLYIQGAPTFISPPQNITAKEGQDAMFTCRAEGYPTNIKYSWQYNGEPVSTSPEIRGRNSALGDGTLIIYNLVADDGGTVTCRASNGYGTAPIASATLLVQFSARVHLMPPIRYAGLGLQAVLPCPAIAVPPVTTATWHKDGQVLLVNQMQRYSLGENMSLIIDQVTKKDYGRYSCIPYNILGTLGESTGTRLIIKAPPYFTELPKRIYEAEIGKELLIPCQGSGDPTPHASWVKLDESFANEEIEDAGRITVEGGNLTISTVIKSDHGRWQCVLSNAVASIRTNVLINVKYTTPHAVSNITVVTHRRSAEISWVPGYDGGYAQHFMIWYKRADMGDHSWQTHSVEGYRRVATVSNLDPDTIYQFALLPENILGSGQFSKTITAKTKEPPPPAPTIVPESVPPPSRLQYHADADGGPIILLWQPPLDMPEEDLLGYIIEYRMLLEAGDEEDPSSTPSTPNSEQRGIYGAPLQRTKRRIRSLISRLRRKKRDAVNTTPALTTMETVKPNKWSKWSTLSPVQANETSYVVPSDKLYRDQFYEFQVFVASKSAYSTPTPPLKISTKGMLLYPVLVPEPQTDDQTSPAAVAGVVAGILFVIIVIVITTVWCFQRRRGKNALGNATFTFERVDDDAFDNRSRSKSESPSRKSLESKSSTKDRQSKNGPIAKLKKKMLKVDIDLGHTYSTTEEEAGLVRKLSTGVQSSQQSDNNAQPVIRRISRASDGKFHVSDESSARSESVLDAGEADSLIASKAHAVGISSAQNSMRHSRAHSAEWDPRSPLLPTGSSLMIRDPVPQTPSDSLEIDCSQSDIEVRYVKDGPHKGRWQSGSTTSLIGPRQYSLARRQMEPHSALDSSGASSSFQTPQDYQKSPSPYVRQCAASPAYSGVPPYAQYVHFKDLVHLRNDGTPRRPRNPEYRVSSPPRFSDYNPTPGSPPKYRYHKHADQPGGHYHVSPRDSYSSPADRLVYDPRYAPIYEVGPYSPGHPGARHSSFVVDSRRMHPPHHNVHQMQPLRVPTNAGALAADGASYPSWNDRTHTHHYHTLPFHSAVEQGAPNKEESAPSSVEASLRRHSENAVAKGTEQDEGQSGGFATGAYTNSLGRSRARKDSETSGRRRVWSVDDLTRDSPVTSRTGSLAERAGSYDLLSPPRSHTNNHRSLLEDRKQDGSERPGGSNGSDMSSSSDSDKVPRGAVTSRNADLREGATALSSGLKHTEDASTLQDEDSSAVSSMVTPRDSLPSDHPTLEGVSSGYDSHNTSHTSDSSPSLPSNTLQPACHDRTSTASSSDRSRKDTSSVDDKYEWDSEFAMESEILEALRHFGTHKRTGSVSRALLEEIRKLGMDKLHEMEESDFVNLEKAVASRSDVFSCDDVIKLPVDTSDMYTKESMERRCAALKKEYQRYQMEQFTRGSQQDSSVPQIHPEPVRTTSHETPTNA